MTWYHGLVDDLVSFPLTKPDVVRRAEFMKPAATGWCLWYLGITGIISLVMIPTFQVILGLAFGLL